LLGNDATLLRHIQPFVSAAFGLSIVVFFISLNFLFYTRTMKLVCKYFGQISYPIYLFHLVILYVLARFLTPHNEPWSFLWFAAAVVSFATIFYYGFERPILASRPRYQHASPSLAPVGESAEVV
jgi:peptidoglycan/LPS O-acetylase OafA/YrhL